MDIAVAKKPRRVNVAALLNILVGVVGLAAILMFAQNPDVAAKLKLDSWRLWISTGLNAALILSSIWAIMGRRNSHFVMLGAAALYYGALIYQNASLLKYGSELFSQGGEGRLWGNIVRSSLELALTAWAVLSAKTRAYFAALYGAP